mgnify:CR=1 FL=1
MVTMLTAYYDSSIASQVYLNTGWSSAYNKNQEKILTQEAEIVLAHELGKRRETHCPVTVASYQLLVDTPTIFTYYTSIFC